MWKQYKPNAKAYKLHFRNQRGGAPLPGFKEVGIQRGYGLGSMFRSLFRSAISILKSGAKTVGKAALKTGMGVANDVLNGKDICSAASTRVKQTGHELKQLAMNAARNALTSQTGQGRKRKAATTNNATGKKARQTSTIKGGKGTKTISPAQAKGRKTTGQAKRKLIQTKQLD